jgi:hypothetical protein
MIRVLPDSMNHATAFIIWVRGQLGVQCFLPVSGANERVQEGLGPANEQTLCRLWLSRLGLGAG